MFYAVLVAARDQDEAQRIAEQVVNERLAACVNVVSGVSSTYVWRGEVERASEALLLMKTSREKLDYLFKRVKELHSYEVPEILALPIERGSPEYLKWLEESLR
ncbi:MAG: divalent-cation tolerance protein CutA [Candidatus Hodarchaeaceae archaeon]|nr:divalent-cation tolerance protein CutA [Candidatus Hodarchaeaceae archaeon]